MTSLGGKRYLEEVLGWKGLPESLIWPAAANEGALETFIERVSFAVYAPAMESEDRTLLMKMMSAIGLKKFDLIETREDMQRCLNILWFSSSEPDIDDKQIKIWKFDDLARYSSGLPSEVMERKKQAWDQLKQFKSEVLSE